MREGDNPAPVVLPEKRQAFIQGMKSFFEEARLLAEAARQIERIATGWRLRKVAESRIVCTHAQTPEAILAPKTIIPADLKACEELGEALGQGRMTDAARLLGFARRRQPRRARNRTRSPCRA